MRYSVVPHGYCCCVVCVIRVFVIHLLIASLPDGNQLLKTHIHWMLFGFCSKKRSTGINHLFFLPHSLSTRPESNGRDSFRTLCWLHYTSAIRKPNQRYISKEKTKQVCSACSKSQMSRNLCQNGIILFTLCCTFPLAYGLSAAQSGCVRKQQSSSSTIKCDWIRASEMNETAWCTAFDIMRKCESKKMIRRWYKCHIMLMRMDTYLSLDKLLCINLHLHEMPYCVSRTQSKRVASGAINVYVQVGLIVCVSVCVKTAVIQKLGTPVMEKRGRNLEALLICRFISNNQAKKARFLACNKSVSIHQPV